MPDFSHHCDGDKGSAWSHHGGATVSSCDVLFGNLCTFCCVLRLCTERTGVAILEVGG